MTTPDLDRIRLWVEALESGEYQQGTRALRRADDTYCCLGVACEIAVRNGLAIDVAKHDDYITYNNTSGTLPLPVREWYGIDESNPQLAVTASRYVTAVDLNDDHGMSFTEIAAAIRRTYLPEATQ